jgi:chromosome segregation ATPase
MTTAAKSTRTSSDQVAQTTGSVPHTSLVDRLAGDLLDRVTEADGVLRHILDRDGKPTIAETSYFASEHDWHVANTPTPRGKKSLRNELARMSRVMRFERAAGTKADREALAKEVDRTAAELRKQGPALDEKIAKLQAEKAQLERAASSTERRLCEAEQAAENLRECVPAEITAIADQATAIVKQSELGERLRELESRAAELRTIITMEGEQIVFYCSMYRREWLIGAGARVHATHWDNYRSQCERELVDLLPQLAQAKQAYDEALEAAKAPLDFYVL